MSVMRRALLGLRDYSSGVTPRLRQLRAAEWLSAEEVRQLHRRALEEMLLRAYRHVPHYHRLFREAGLIDASERVRLEAVSELPLLSRQELRAHFTELTSTEATRSKVRRNASGGSTGEPAQFLQDDTHAAWVLALKRLYDSWSGYYPGEPRALLWGASVDVRPGQETPKIKLARWLRNELWLNSFQMTPEVMQEYAEALSAFRPVQIQAYAESAYQLARFCASHDLKVARPRAIMSSACTLHPHLRETIETVFGAPVFNRYGSREVGDVACECAEHRGLHVPPLTHHVEILRPDLSPCEPGETGEIVVTQLTNAVMPLIRYRIGDMGYWSTEPCGCGRHWPLLGGVTGRSADVLRRRDGGLVDGNYFPHLFKDKVWVESFQVVQEEYEKVKIKIVRAGEAAGPSFDRDGELAAITAAVRQALGPDCAVNYEFVAAIPPTASGKHRCSICAIK